MAILSTKNVRFELMDSNFSLRMGYLSYLELI
jgi:hypothetical protein